MDQIKHTHHSTLRERIVEHVFVGDVLRRLWQNGIADVEVLRPEFDVHGYDVVMARGKIVRHVQLKTGMQKKPAKVSVARALGKKPSGCVIWIHVTRGLDMGPFHWFGNKPGLPLPKISNYPHPRRATHNKSGERPLRQNHHEVPSSEFSTLATLDEVLAELFGLPKESP